MTLFGMKLYRHDIALSDHRAKQPPMAAGGQLPLRLDIGKCERVVKIEIDDLTRPKQAECVREDNLVPTDVGDTYAAISASLERAHRAADPTQTLVPTEFLAEVGHQLHADANP